MVVGGVPKLGHRRGNADDEGATRLRRSGDSFAPVGAFDVEIEPLRAIAPMEVIARQAAPIPSNIRLAAATRRLRVSRSAATDCSALAVTQLAPRVATIRRYAALYRNGPWLKLDERNEERTRYIEFGDAVPDCLACGCPNRDPKRHSQLDLHRNPTFSVQRRRNPRVRHLEWRRTPQFSGRVLPCEARSKRTMQWRACCAHATTDYGRLYGDGTMTSICRSSFTCQIFLACRRANLLYSPAISALEHDRIAIQQHVVRDNPHGLGELPDSQKEQRD